MNAPEIIGRGWSFPPTVNAQGGIALTSHHNEVEQAIRIILTTAPGQRLVRTTFGCRLHELVFAPNNSQTAAQACRFVEEALEMWEPRIRLTQVNSIPDPLDTSRLLIEITYDVKSNHDRRSLVYPFYLIPEETNRLEATEFA